MSRREEYLMKKYKEGSRICARCAKISFIGIAMGIVGFIYSYCIISESDYEVANKVIEHSGSWFDARFAIGLGAMILGLIIVSLSDKVREKIEGKMYEIKDRVNIIR